MMKNVTSPAIVAFLRTVGQPDGSARIRMSNFRGHPAISTQLAHWPRPKYKTGFKNPRVEGLYRHNPDLNSDEFRLRQ